MASCSISTSPAYYDELASDTSLASFSGQSRLVVYAEFEQPRQLLRVLDFDVLRLPMTTGKLTIRWLKRTTVRMLGGMRPCCVVGATIRYGRTPASMAPVNDETAVPEGRNYVVSSHGLPRRPEETTFQLPQLTSSVRALSDCTMPR